MLRALVLRRVVMGVCGAVALMAAAPLPLGGAAKTHGLAVDLAHGNLFVAHSDHIDVVSLAANKVVGAVYGVSNVKDVVLAPNGHGYASSSKNSSVVIFDAVHFNTLGVVKAGADVGAMLYEPLTQRVFAMNDDDDTISVIDTATDKFLATIDLPGSEGLEAAAADGAGHIYVNHSAEHEVLKINARSLLVEQHYALPGCAKEIGLALNDALHVAYVSCSNNQLVVLDLIGGRQIGAFPTGKGSGSVLYNSDKRRIYVACGEGFVSVFSVDSANSYHALGPIKSAPDARWAALDAALHILFLVSDGNLIRIAL